MNLKEAGGSYLMENVDIGFKGQRELTGMALPNMTQTDALSKMR